MIFPGDISKMPYLTHGKSRAINAENRTGEKGKGGMAASPLGPSRKGSPCLNNIQPGQEEFLADENGGKAVMDEWLLENLNVTFDWQYMTGDMTERLNLMLADNSYPSVITNMPDDMAEKFIAQGKAVDLTDYLDDMPNLTRRMGDYINMLKDDEGHIYKLSTLWGENPSRT